MKFLKGLAISLLSFILFLSLGVFGTVYMLNNTFLNPDFVVAQVDRLDVASLAREVTEGQIGGNYHLRWGSWKKLCMMLLLKTNRG